VAAEGVQCAKRAEASGLTAVVLCMDGDGDRRDSQTSAGDHNADPCAAAQAQVQIAVAQLLRGYFAVLDSIEADRRIVFRSSWAIPCGQSGRRRAPRANFTARILAQAHVAARLDMLLARGRRCRAVDPRGQSPFDLDYLQDFRDSLSPVKRRTLTVWVTLAALAIAFPVAWATDRLRLIAPKVIICSPKSLFARLTLLTGRQPVRTSCKPSPKSGVVQALTSAAHVKLTPGGVLDSFQKLRLSGLWVILLLAVIWILCISIVLLAFRSGFRLKRLAFLTEGDAAASPVLPFWPESTSGGMYSLERKVFKAVHIPPPQEFPLDLAVSVGVLVLPITIAVDLLTVTVNAHILAPKVVLTIAAAATLMLVIIRLGWLIRVWLSRSSARKMPPSKIWLPDGSIILIRGGAQGTVFLGSVYAMWLILIISEPGETLAYRVTLFLVSVPLISWLIGIPWWYRLFREFRHYPHSSSDLKMFPFVATSLIVPIAIGLLFITGDGDWGLVFWVGLLCVVATQYGMTRRMDRARGHASSAKWKIFLQHLRAVTMCIAPFMAAAYVNYAINQLWNDKMNPRFTDIDGVTGKATSQ
jgi:hypothetical protein